MTQLMGGPPPPPPVETPTQRPNQRRWVWPTITIAALVVGAAGGYLAVGATGSDTGGLQAQVDDLAAERDDLAERLDEALVQAPADQSAGENDSDTGTDEAGSGEDTSTSAEPEGSRDNPFVIGELVATDGWEVALGEPREAWDEMQAYSEFTDPPEDGMEFYIIPVTATYVGEGSDDPGWALDVEFVGEDNRTYSDPCGSIPEPLMNIDDLYNGGRAEGNVCVAVPKGAPGLWALTIGYSEPVFFATE